MSIKGWPKFDEGSIEYLRRRGYSVHYEIRRDDVKLLVFYAKKYHITIEHGDLLEICEFVDLI